MFYYEIDILTEMAVRKEGEIPPISGAGVARLDAVGFAQILMRKSFEQADLRAQRLAEAG